MGKMLVCIRFLVPIVAPLALLAAPSEARAALGEAPLAGATALRALAAVERGNTFRSGYAVHHLATDAGAVREFTGADGIVFAVVWDGQAPPDPGLVLGAYAPEVRDAFHARVRAPGRGSELRTQNVVVQTWGHMRALHGRAFLPALVPQGVNVDDLR